MQMRVLALGKFFFPFHSCSTNNDYLWLDYVHNDNDNDNERPQTLATPGTNGPRDDADAS
jgi:hypothetical protein